MQNWKLGKRLDCSQDNCKARISNWKPMTENVQIWTHDELPIKGHSHDSCQENGLWQSKWTCSLCGSKEGLLNQLQKAASWQGTQKTRFWNKFHRAFNHKASIHFSSSQSHKSSTCLNQTLQWSTIFTSVRGNSMHGFTLISKLTAKNQQVNKNMKWTHLVWHFHCGGLLATKHLCISLIEKFNECNVKMPLRN